MTDKIYIEKYGSSSLELQQINADVTRPTFTGMGNGNPRLVDAINLMQACRTYLNKDGQRSPPEVLFVYRGVAVGGIQRKLGGFSSKPLTVKVKSINPTILTDDLKRLSGLVPIQDKLRKGGVGDTAITPGPGEAAYRVKKVASVGNAQSYLYVDSLVKFSWESVSGVPPQGKTLCTFLGDGTNPYLADWDLVLVGVTKYSVQNTNMFKVENFGNNIQPNWLYDCINNQTTPLANHVTQHGPESLYCGNALTDANEEFLVLTSGGNLESWQVINSESYRSSDSRTPWAKTRERLDHLGKIYFLYEFSAFTGSPQTINYGNEISQLNAQLVSVR